MAQDNRISAELTEQAKQNILKAIASIRKELDFLVNLTPTERRDMPKMGDRTIPFVDKSLDYSSTNEHLVPPFLEILEFRKDMALVNDLTDIERPLLSLVEGIQDTKLLAGSEAYGAALVFYQAVKLATQLNIPGVKSIYEDLRERFPGRRVQGNGEMPANNGGGALENDVLE